MNVDALTRTVTGRSPKHLRQAAFVLALCLLLVGGLLAYVQRQYLQESTDYTNNPNVHYVKTNTSGQGASLAFHDVERITSVAAKADPDVRVVPVLSIDYGISSGNKDFFVLGIGNDDGALIGQPVVRDGVAYRTDGSTSDLELQVPVVEVADGGMTSGATVPLSLASVALSSNTPYFTLGHTGNDTLFVSKNTFATIVEYSFGVDWPTFMATYDAGSPYGINVIESVFIYVPKLSRVDAVANALGDSGYAVSYTLAAFHDMADTLFKNVVVGAVAGVLIVTAAIAASAALLRAYVLLVRRDMGVLRHYGFDVHQVLRMYRARIARSFMPAVVLGALEVVVLWALWTRGPVRFLVLDVGIIVVVMVIVMAVVVGVMLRREVRRPVLELLKIGREFG